MRMRILFVLSLLLPCIRAAFGETGGTLVATYRLTVPGEPASEWRLTRSDDCVTAERIGAPLVERWQRLKNGDVRYLRVFPARRYVIEYRPADVAVEWDVVSGAFDARPGSTPDLTEEVATPPRPCDGDLAGYAWLDFADAGDRHDDPVVRELLGHTESWTRALAALGVEATRKGALR
jgi:hypothetical protein